MKMKTDLQRRRPCKIALCRSATDTVPQLQKFKDPGGRIIQTGEYPMVQFQEKRKHISSQNDENDSNIILLISPLFAETE